MQEKKSKICFVAAADITVKFLLLSQLKFLENNGYDTRVIYSGERWKKEIEAEGIKTRNIKIARKISPFSDLISLLKLYIYFKKEKFDAVFTFTPKPGLLGQVAAKMAGIPVIINTIFGYYFHESTPFLKRKFFIFIEKIAAKFSDIVFFRNKEDFKTAGKEKIVSYGKAIYIGDGIDILRFDPQRFSADFIKNKKEKLGIASEKIVIGIVARLVKEKGYLELFSAFGEVVKVFPEAILLAVGPSDTQKKDCISPDIVKDFKMEKNVIFLGEREDVDEILSVIDIFTLPSHREGFPHSVMEASSMGKPVVATDIRGCREAVENGITGILVPPGNPDKLAEKNIYLLENREISEEMGRNGREKAVKEFDERLVFDRIKKEYERLLAQKNI